MEQEIEKVSIAVQIKGQVYYVNLPQEQLKLVVRIASGLSESGSLRVTKAPEGQFLEVIKQ